MREVSRIGPVSSVLAIIAGLSMSSVALAAPSVTLNNTACGSYTSVRFDTSGNLVITGELNCLDADSSTGDGSTGGDKVPANVVFVDQPWSSNIAADVRDPVRLSSGQKYTVKINKPLESNVKGYGNIVHINTTNRYGVRTVVISEELGSMVPVADGGTFRGESLCSTVGIEGVVNWSFDDRYPRGLYCRLDPTKQYYINVAHQNSSGKDTCPSGLCEFSPSYNKMGDL